ncbi:MAG: hypothetical protein ACO3CJ_10225, partial [Burkholderiaceae bacterium]
MHTVVVVLARLRPSAVGWAVSRLVLSAFGTPRWPGLVFQKVLGSGEQGGFGLKPGLNFQGLFSAFDNLQSANDFVEHAPQVKAYQDRAEEFFVAVLNPVSARGQWSGFELQAELTHKETPHEITPDAETLHAATMDGEPVVASLTRASIRPFKARQFWAQSPDAERDLEQTNGCLLAV